MADFYKLRGTDEWRRDYRVGRCRTCSGKPAYYWRADTGLRLDDVRCLHGHPLDRTSREAHGFRALPEPEAQRRARVAILRTKIQEAADVAAAWTTEEYEAQNPERAERARFMRDSYERSIEEYQKAIKRLERAASRELAALSGGSTS